MDSENTLQAEIIIAGGGMVGLSLAIALARENMRVAVIERDALQARLLPAFDGRVSAIALGSKRLLEAIGAWEGMAAFAEPILDIRVSDGASPFFLDYHHADVGDEPFGWIVENRHIRSGLQQATTRYPHLEVLAPARIAAYTAHEGRVEARLQDGCALCASLLIAADGKNSEIRRMAGIPAHRSDYRQTAIVCTIAHEKPHAGLAQERFLPAGPFAVLPMQHNRSSLVWVEPRERAQAYAYLPAPEISQEIRARVGEYLGGLQVEGSVFTYPLELVHAGSYTAPRLALIGDAAHAIHPIAGQGVNLGFRDAGVLHQVIAERFRLGLDIGAPDALAHYQRWRRFDNFTMIAVTDILNRAFSTSFLPVQLARGLGLWGVDTLPGLKRVFMRHAMGIVGDLPVLMRG